MHLFGKRIEEFQSNYDCFTWDAPAHAESKPYALDFTLVNHLYPNAQSR